MASNDGSSASSALPAGPEYADDADDGIIGKALVASLVVFAALGLVVVAALFFLVRAAPAPQPMPIAVSVPRPQQLTEIEPPALSFTDITQAAGINLVRENGAEGEKLLPETMGGGCAFFDYDNDGDQDLLLVNSCRWPWSEKGAEPRPTLALYQNDGHGKFANVTEAAGLDLTFYGMGVACGDYDADGWVDLFFTAVGKNRLLRNDQGKFAEVTDAAGVGGADDAWSTAAAWFDADNDGDLDLYVGNYVRWSREIDLAQNFTLVGGGARAYGPPNAFEGSFPYFYRNEGNGQFQEMAAQAGMHVRNENTQVPVAKTMGVVPIDFDHDGLLDLIVANDTVQNFVFRNLGQAKFEEVGAAAGIAFDANGGVRGAMGIDAAPFRNDQCLGVAIGNFSSQMMGLYVSFDDPSQFVDAANATGLGPQTRLELTFGLFFADLDLDGRPELVAANGHLEEAISTVDATQHYAQSPALFWNAGPAQKSEFLKLPAEKVGPDFHRPLVGRGSAFADIDADGDLDLVICQPHGPPRLLRNDQQLGHHWLRVQLSDEGANRHALGAWIEVASEGVLQHKQVMPTRSYLSQVELPVTFGLGNQADPVEVRIVWPSGEKQTVAGVKPNQVLRVSRTAQAK